MCKVIEEYKIAYEDFQNKTQAQNVIIDSLELQIKKLTEERDRLTQQLENKKTLLKFYGHEREDFEKAVRRLERRYDDWKIGYRIKWKWGITLVGLIILALEIHQFILFTA